MKTRIISGAVIVIVVGAVLALSLEYPAILLVACSILSAVAVYEVLYATGIVKNKFITAVACAFSILFTGNALVASVAGAEFIKIWESGLFYVVFAFLQFALYLKFHKDIKLEGMFGMVFMPIIISYAFQSLYLLTTVTNSKLFYIILVLCWSAVSDTGAYFTGVTLGNHKMAPVISPKKSWEGLIGGMVFSLLAVFGVCALYNSALGVKVNTFAAMLITPLFVLIGVLGDLTASLIKRKCGIKDFGKLIPGHGGILDRFDSILMISPAVAALLDSIPLIK